MKKLLAMFLAALCMVLCLVPMTALAETEPVVPAEPVGNSETVMPVVTIDVGGANTENENYKIDDTGISLLKRNVQYVLTGTTDKRSASGAITTAKRASKRRITLSWTRPRSTAASMW